MASSTSSSDSSSSSSSSSDTQSSPSAAAASKKSGAAARAGRANRAAGKARAAAKAPKEPAKRARPEAGRPRQAVSPEAGRPRQAAGRAGRAAKAGPAAKADPAAREGPVTRAGRVTRAGPGASKPRLAASPPSPALSSESHAFGRASSAFASASRSVDVANVEAGSAVPPASAASSAEHSPASPPMGPTSAAPFDYSVFRKHPDLPQFLKASTSGWSAFGGTAFFSEQVLAQLLDCWDTLTSEQKISSLLSFAHGKEDQLAMYGTAMQVVIEKAQSDEDGWVQAIAGLMNDLHTTGAVNFGLFEKHELMRQVYDLVEGLETEGETQKAPMVWHPAAEFYSFEEAGSAGPLLPRNTKFDDDYLDGLLKEVADDTREQLRRLGIEEGLDRLLPDTMLQRPFAEESRRPLQSFLVSDSATRWQPKQPVMPENGVHPLELHRLRKVGAVRTGKPPVDVRQSKKARTRSPSPARPSKPPAPVDPTATVSRDAPMPVPTSSPIIRPATPFLAGAESGDEVEEGSGPGPEGILPVPSGAPVSFTAGGGAP